MKIKGRGNHTWVAYPKRPYRIKLDEKYPILGMPSDKDWVLLANYADKSLLRTAISFEASRLIEMPWTPKAKYVEVFLNGKYEGQYLLTEHVKADKNRINIDKDGFLAEIDTYYYAEPFYCTSSWRYNFTFKEPDPATTENTAYFLSLINNFETALTQKNYNIDTGYRKYMDMESFAKWYIVNQFLANIDPNKFFFVKNRTEGILYMSPVWDFDWSLGYADTGWGSVNTVNHDFYTDYPYFKHLLEDPDFKEEVRKQWLKMKQNIPLLYNYINETAQLIKASADANFERWDAIYNTGVTRLQKWENEVQFIKNYLSERTIWFDAFIMK
jgi:hypothetical protein